MGVTPNTKLKKTDLKEIDRLNAAAWKEHRKNPELAIKMAKEAYLEGKKLKHFVGQADSMHTMGASYAWLSEFDEASNHLEKSLVLYTSLEEIDKVADTIYTIGVVDYLKGDFKKSRTNFHKCLDIYLNTKNEIGETNAYNGLGSVYTESGAYEEAWDYLNRGLKISIGAKETDIRPKILDGLATVCNLRGEHEKAITFFEESRRLNKDQKNQNQESYNLQGIGESYMRMKNYAKAKEYFQECIDIRKKLGFKVGEAQSEHSLGNVFLQQKDYAAAQKHLLYALDLSKKTNGKNIEMLVSKSLAELYELTEDYKKFPEHLKNYYRLKSELFSEEAEKQQSYELEKASLNTKILSEIGQEIISSLELEKVLFTIYEKVNKLMDASVFGIGLYFPEKEIVDYKLVIDRGKKLEPYTRDMNDKSQLAVWTIENKSSIFINDVEREKSEYGEAFSTKKEIELHKRQKTVISNVEQSYIYVPIMSGEDVIGVITVQSFEKNAYSKDHLAVLKNIAVYASIGVINARMYETLQDKINLSNEIVKQKEALERSYHNTKILSDITHAISSSLSQSEIIRKVYKSVNNIMDAAVFGIGIIDSKKQELVFEGLIEKGKTLPAAILPLSEKNMLAVYSFTNKEEIILNDWDKEIKKYIKDAPKIASGKVPSSVIYLPLLLNEEVLGVITVQSFEKNAYADYHLDIIRNIAANVPKTLESAMLYKQMEDEVKRRTSEVIEQKEAIEKSYQSTKLMGEIGMDIISTLELDRVLFTIYEKVNKLMDATVFGIGIYNAEEKTIEYKLAIDRGEKYKPYTRDATDKSQFAVWCIDHMEPVFINDVEKEQKRYLEKFSTDSELGLLEPVDEEQEKSIMYVPLISGNKVIGVISVQSYEKNAYTHHQLDILQNLAIFLSTALVNAVLYESMEEKVKTRTEELVLQKEKAEKLMEKAEFEKEEARYQRKRAEQSERFKQQFLANMSHEIRTPMNAIMGMTNLLLEKDPKKEHISYLNTIRLSSETLLVIINDILDLSKIEAGKMELEQIDFSLEEVLNLVESTLSYRAEEKGLVLSVSYDDEIPKVLVGDSVRLQQVLMNISGNAIKFTEKGGISISANLEGGLVLGDQAKVRFEIRDTGIGMTREQQNKVFENFSQASSDTTRKYGGTGLGLSISSKLVDLFGSSIKLESEIGHGSTFHFVINFKVSKNQEVKSVERNVSESMIKELTGLRVLLAEDNEYNRIVASETLELKIPKVKVIFAHNGAEAVRLAEENAGNIDVVLMDVQMPVMDGFDATANIRKSSIDKVKKLPIIALTASVIKADIQKCFDAGMNGYIPKPFKTSELLQSIYHTVIKGIHQQDFEKYIDDSMDVATKKNKVSHLSFLQEFTEGDTKRMKRYVEIYLDSAKANIPKLNNHLEKGQHEQLSVLVHSMKPHFDFMGMPFGRDLAEKIEQLIASKEDFTQLPKLCSSLLQVIEQSIDELKESIADLT